MKYETRHYSFITLRYGATLQDKSTGREVYFRPGDDTDAICRQVEALEEVPLRNRERIANILFADYIGG